MSYFCSVNSFLIHWFIFLSSNRHFIFNVSYFCSVILLYFHWFLSYSVNDNIFNTVLFNKIPNFCAHGQNFIQLVQFLFNNFRCPIGQRINFAPFWNHLTFCCTKVVEHTELMFTAKDMEETVQRGIQRGITSFRSNSKSSRTLFFMSEYLVEKARATFICI